MAMVIHALRQDPALDARVISTGQHREMLDQTLAVFDIDPDVDLGAMRPGQSLADLTATLITATTRTFEVERPDFVLVQGDTTTVFAAALAAFYLGIPVGHIEAGLRSGNDRDPFPEEMNRKLAGRIATVHFAPTERSHRNLIAEGVSPDTIHVTGNTGIDALRFIESRLPPLVTTTNRTLLVTLHRRENWGETMAGMCHALRDVLEARPDVDLVFPMHRNPQVRSSVETILGDHPRARLIEPVDYQQMIDLQRRSYLVLTDSGGLQEEAPSLGKPLLVLRDTTERPEAIEAGCARLVGTNPAQIVRETLRLLDDRAAYQTMARVANPFGDGHAAGRIVAILRRYLGVRDTRA